MCSFVCLGAAQTEQSSAPKKKDPPPGTLQAVVVKGNHRYSSQDIIRIAGLQIGQHITGPAIEQARVKIQKTELFNNVADEYRFTGAQPPEYTVTFNLTENAQVFPMRFERLNASPDAIREYLRSHIPLYAEEIPGTEAVLNRYKACVEDFVHQRDPALKLKVYVSNDDPKQLAVVFTPDTPAPTISQVFVSGNEAVDTGTLLRAVNAVAIGVPLSDQRLKMILDGAIKPVYAARGYAAVSFPKIDTEPSKTDRGVIVRVQISEGPLFKFGTIRFRGTGLDEDEVRSAVPFKPGVTYSLRQVDDVRLDLVHRLRRRGYLDASISSDTQADDSRHVVNVTYNVVPGSIYNFETLDIQGLDLTSSPVIERLWGEKPGKPFNPDYPDFFLKRVQEQGLFDNLADTTSDYTADAASHNVTVHLYFKGGESRALKEKKKKEQEEKNKTDGTWSPFPVAG